MGDQRHIDPDQERGGNSVREIIRSMTPNQQAGKQSFDRQSFSWMIMRRTRIHMHTQITSTALD
jgi:hypothetical protein